MLHLAHVAVWKFNEKNNRFPALHSEADADAVLAIAKEINTAAAAAPKDSALVVDGLDENIVRQVSLYYAVELPAITALFGGVVAQEITKQTGKSVRTANSVLCSCCSLVSSTLVSLSFSCSQVLSPSAILPLRRS